jgi:PAS domain S-box-containing protein
VAENLTGWKRDEAAGRSLTEVFRIVNEATRGDVENPALRAMHEGSIMGLANHTLLLNRAGTECAIDDSAAPIRDGAGRVVGSVLVFRDVTARRQSETLLRRAEERSRSVVDNVLDGIITIDDAGRIRSFNRAAESLFGFAADEVIGQNVKMLMPEPYHSEHDGYLNNYLKTGRARIIGIGREVVGLRKDGSTFPMELAVSEFSVASDRYFTGIVRDLTERNQRDEALREGEARFRVALEGTPVAVFNCDRDLRFTWLYNSRAPFEASRAIGKRADEVLPGDSVGELVDLMHDVLTSGQGERRVVAIPLGADMLYFDSAVEPMRGEHGKIVGVRGAMADISERRRIDVERERMARALREADQRKNEFLATLAHELRNPLAPIKNSISILQLKGPPDPELVEARAVIDRQVRQMSRLLDDLLEVNRLDRKKFELRKQSVTLSTVIQSALESASPGIERGRHHVDLELRDDVVIEADPLRLSQVFANLLTNAAKYTDDGGQIWIHAALDGDFVDVSVRDNGMGISAESGPRLFEMFSQVPSTLERARGGVGIGLSLAKGLVELHGGSIAAHSEGIGKGSTFTVRLPIIPGGLAVSAPPEPTLPALKSARRILIADDVRDNADTLAMVLRALGHTVEVAYDGVEALATAANFRPELGVFDIAMPLMNGLDACRQIRSQPWGKSIFMIAQTGWGQEEDRRRATEAGFDRHMLKPVDVGSLMAVLASLPERADESPPSLNRD